MKNFLKIGTGAVLGSLAIMCVSSAAFAVSSSDANLGSPVALSTLDGTTSSNNLTVGNATFQQFAFSNPGGTALGGPSDSMINVQTLENQDAGGTGNVGVRFTAGWNSAAGTMDSVISYHLHLNQAINSIGVNNVDLSFNGVSNNGTSGNAYADVSETVQDASTGKLLGTLSVYNGNVSGTGIANNQTDTLNLGGNYTNLILTKDIMVTATPGGNATISLVDNGFGGTNLTGGPPPAPTPEPMSLALIPLGLVGLGLRKKLARA